ncbi:MAG: amidohydrolase family protein [Mycobacterium sp.]
MAGTARSAALAQRAAETPLVDHHVHGCWLVEGDRGRFESGLNEANTEPVAAFDSPFDTQLGFAVRAHCAPVLGLAKHAESDDYWQHRCEFSEQQLAHRLLPAAGVSDWLIDTGFAHGVADPDQVAQFSGGRTHEVVRLEQVAEQAARTSGDYADAFRAVLRERAADAVATKSVLAYRGGFEGDLSRPAPRDVVEAAARWRDHGGTRLTDRTLLRFGLHEGLALGKPLQLHVGLGDRDCDLHRTNPMHLLDFLRGSGETPIMLLHCYPYEREAGYLAQAFNHVYLDGGLAINFLGARSAAMIARLLELAPFRKILYSSDAFGPAELHYLGAALWRNGIRDVLQRFVDAGEWSEPDALRVLDLIAHGNARRVYQLPV